MKKDIKYLIVTPSYNENCGGHIALHKLCDELVSLGYSACVAPIVNNYILNKFNWRECIKMFFKDVNHSRRKIKINPYFNTPIATKQYINEAVNNGVVLYPEIVSGNPYGAKNVVRWFLHHPNYFNKNVLYGFDELYFKYSSWVNIPGSIKNNVVDELLRIVHYPFEIYNEVGTSENRSGSAYTIRKGIGKEFVHDLKDSILIDGMSHAEVASIFKKVKTFYSYDVYTAYSAFAVLCGCDSIVIPDAGVAKDEWIPDERHRVGIAYGVDDLKEARLTREVLIKNMMDEQGENKRNVCMFVENVNKFFTDI